MASRSGPVKVLFAAAEASPVARVGGLAEAAAGLIRSLRTNPAVDLTVVLPDYGGLELVDEKIESLDVPEWIGPGRIRRGRIEPLGEVLLVRVRGLERPHPYVETTGEGWTDNADRFFGFSAGVASVAEALEPDVVHLNDWHTGMTLAWIDTPSVYTIHTLGYQGQANIGWLETITTERAASFEQWGDINPAAGAIRLADKVIAVSPNYAIEILDPTRSAGLHTLLAARGDDLIGIRNGIDVELWNPATDPELPATYDIDDRKPKSKSKKALAQAVGLAPGSDPLIGMVTRLVDQKGLDLALGLVPYLERMGARMVLLGSGDERLALWARDLATNYATHFAFVDAYDAELAHRIFAGADLFLMPSRFEPCGLAQMQAMAYGTIPVVTPVGGLVDTVVDDDDPATRRQGNGFVALTVDAVGVADALHRSIRAWRDRRRRAALQDRGMSADWSWDAPAAQHVELYRTLARTTATRSLPRTAV